MTDKSRYERTALWDRNDSDLWGFLDMVKHDFVTFQRIRYGAVAQLAERVARIHEARGSNPLSSITLI